MCGIVGLTYNADLTFPGDNREQVFWLAELTLERGRDGFGAATIIDGKFHALHMLKFSRTGLEKWFDRIGWDRHPIIMASRAQPLPEAESTIGNIQPHRCGSPAEAAAYLVHNGTISNDKELAEFFGVPRHDVDTATIAEIVGKTKIMPSQEIVGGFAFILLTREGMLRVWKNTKTLWFASDRKKFACVASDPSWLSDVFGAGSMKAVPLERVPSFSTFEVDQNGRAHGAVPIKTKVWSSTPDLDDNKAVVVTSGGIDSVTAAHVAQKVHGKEVTLVNFDHGQRSANQEREASWYAAKQLECGWKEIQLPWLGALGCSPLTDRGVELPLGMKSAESTLCWTPGRNLVMVSAAAAIAEAEGAKWIYFGNNLEEEGSAYGDNDLEFIYLFNDLLRLGTLKGVQIKRALAKLMKPEILAVGTKLGVDYSATWSCDEGHGKPCGICGCCTTRRYAFKRAGLPDPQEYLEPLRDEYPWTDAKEIDVDFLMELLEAEK